MFRDFFFAKFSGIAEWEKGLIYFGAAYFMGYVIYVSSSFLDGWYDKIKRKALGLDKEENKEMELQILKDYTIPNRFLRFLFPHLVDTHNLIVKVVELKNRDIGTDLDGYKHQIIDAYQYSFRRLMAEQPAMFTEVERYYATARFFRSMTLVLLIGGIVSVVWDSDTVFSVWIFVLSIVSLLVFLNRWRKANHVAFKNVIILEGMKNNENWSTEVI